MTTATSDLLLPGYRVDAETGAWLSLPWPSDPEAKAALVRNSLGPAIIDWAEWRTDEPGLTHHLTGLPWRFTPGQKRWMVTWYAVDPETGRLPWRRGVKRGAKGTGKDPFAGALAACELLGPVEVHDWDDRTGRPVGRRRGMPLVQLASNSEAQSKDLLRVVNAMLGAEARAYYTLDCAETRTLDKDTGGRIEILTFAESSNEGDPVTCSLLNETHHMDTEAGRAVAAQARRNVGKSPASVQARSIEFTNAHRQGADSVAERSFEAWQKQQRKGYPGKVDILYDSIEAPPSTDILTARGRLAGLRAAYSDAPWADLERLSDEMMDPDTSVADAIRYYLNGLAAAEDAWVEPGAWDALADPSKGLVKGDAIAMFLDCSKTEDATALIGCRLSDLHVVELGVWFAPKGERGKGWLVPREQVDAMVRWADAEYAVAWFGVDPGPAKDDSESVLYWQALIDEWHQHFRKRVSVWATPGAGGSSVLFDMRLSQPGGGRRNWTFTKAAELVQKWVDEEGPVSVKAGSPPPFTHDGAPTLRLHVHQAKNRPNQWGTSLGKVTRDSKKQVDAAVAMVGAVMGAREAKNSGKVKQKRLSSWGGAVT